MVPKYYALKQEIIKNIENSVYKADQMIPSERELCDIYNLSRITVRKAVEELAVEGYLYKIHGKGTFVKDNVLKQDLFSIVSCTEDIINAGMTPKRQVIEMDVVNSSLECSKALNIPYGQKVFKLERVYYANDYPFNKTITCLPYKYFKDIEKYDFSEKSLYYVIENIYNIKITKAKRTLEAIAASKDVAKYLGIKEGTPVLMFSAVTYGLVKGKEVPIENFETCYRTDKFKFHINQIR